MFILFLNDHLVIKSIKRKRKTKQRFWKSLSFVSESWSLTKFNDNPYLMITFLRTNTFVDRKILRSEINCGQKTFRLFHSIKKTFSFFVMKKFDASGLFSINDSFSRNAKPPFLEKTKQKLFLRSFWKTINDCSYNTRVGRVIVFENDFKTIETKLKG